MKDRAKNDSQTTSFFKGAGAKQPCLVTLSDVMSDPGHGNESPKYPIFTDSQYRRGDCMNKSENVLSQNDVVTYHRAFVSGYTEILGFS